MKAVRVHEFGAASTLRYEEVPDPTPASDEVVIKVEAAGVNPFTLTVNAMRFLWEHGPGVSASDVWWSLLWIAGIFLVFAPVAVARYRRATG